MKIPLTRHLQAGDRIQNPVRRLGTVLVCRANMALVQYDDTGKKSWIRAFVLKLLQEAPK